MSPDQWTIVARGRRTTVYRAEYGPCPPSADGGRGATEGTPPAPKQPIVPTTPACSAGRADDSIPRQAEELVFKGSNTIGAGVLPALIEGYAKLLGASLKGAQHNAAADNAIYELIDPKQGDACLRVSVVAGGSNSALAALIDRQAQVGMSSRPFTDAEIEKLKALRPEGTRETMERILALDALAIVVAPDNRVRSLKLCDVARIFAGQIQEWREVGGEPGPITLHVRSTLSGTFDSFKALILDTCSVPLTSTAIPHESNEAVAAAVAADRRGVGFVPLAGLDETLAPLRITGRCGIEYAPTRFNVKTEDYPLARRLFLYAPLPLSRRAQGFLDFVGSDSAEEIIANTHAVGQEIEREPPEKQGATSTVHDVELDEDPTALGQWRRDTDRAERVSVTYRFQSGSEKLDAKAWQDIRRLVRNFQRTPTGKTVVIAGFADSIGSRETNHALSLRRADAVRQALLSTGAPVAAKALVTEGYGEILPVACNDTALGREKNRRAEVWLRD